MTIVKIAKTPLAVPLLFLAACGGNSDENAAGNGTNVIAAQVNALEDAAAVTASNSTADLLNEQANEVKEIDEARKEVAAKTAH